MVVNVTGGKLSQAENNRRTHGRSLCAEKQNTGKKIATMDIELDGEYVNLKYTFEPVPFNRIRRVTGYLVGTLDRWNDAKKCEEADRVKHNV